MMTAIRGAGRLRFGLAGRNFGLRVLLPAIRLAGHEVVAFAGRDPGSARREAAANGIATACATVEDLLGQPLDAVALALPPADCIAAATLAATREIAVFAEKPLAPSAASARELARVARAPVMVDYEFSGLPSFERLAEAVRSRAWGPVQSVEVVWHSRSRDLAEGRWSWKSDALQGGGVLGLYGCHVVHAIEMMLGPMSEVRATRSAEATRMLAPPGSVAAADRVRIEALVAERIPVRLDLDMASASPPGLRWQVAVEEGVLTLDNHGTGTLARFRLSFARRGLAPALVCEDPEEGDPVVAAVSRLVRRFASGEPGNESVWGVSTAARVLDVLELVEPRS